MKTGLLFLLFSVILSERLVVGEDGHCLWYGECGPIAPNSNLKYNCKYTGPAKAMTNTTGLNLLKTYCPGQIKDDQSVTMTCCGTDQLMTFQSSLGLPQQFLLRCPSCFRNFLNLFCYQTCEPNQSNFMNITQSKQVVLPSGKTGEAVVSVDYYVSEDFSYGMFNSCKDVQMPSANQKALDILCGMPAAQCTPQKWFNFMGDTLNGHTPFKIEFIIDNHPTPPAGSNMTIIPMNVTYTKCSEGAFNKSACSCQDCAATCAPLPTPPSPEKEATILGYDSWYFVMCVLYIAFVIFFSMMYILWYKVIKHDNPYGRHVNMNQEQKDIDEYNSHENEGLKPVDTYSVPMIELKNISYLENLGAAMERFLQRNFTRWGTCCARHPIIVIVVGIIIAGGLSAGITMFKVTTNPVEL